MAHPFEASEVQAGLQAALVPPVLFSGSFIEAFGRSAPKDEIGGDLADLVSHGPDVIAYVMDVSEHGIRSGVLMGMAKTAFRYGLLLGQPLEKLVCDINCVLGPLKERNMYLTLAVLRFTATGDVKYISAGHLPLLHYEQRTASVIRHSMSQFPLGLFAGAQYVSESLSFEPGDVFALVTDGVVETGDNPDAERGLERVSDLLGRLHERSLPDVAGAMLTEATATGAQQDDATVLLLRCSGEAHTGKAEAAEVSQAREVLWSRQLDALEELLAREDKRTNKNDTEH